MGPHVICREQEAILKGSASVQLQRVKCGVPNVAALCDRSERRVRRNACQRIHQVGVGGGKNIRSFIAEITGCCQNIERNFPFNRRGPGRNVGVLPVAIQSARGYDTQAPASANSRNGVNG